MRNTMIKLVNLTLRSAQKPRWNFETVKNNAVSSIVFYDASTTLDRLDEIQKVLVDGLLQEPFYVATGLGSKSDLLQRFTKEYLKERFQEGLSMVATQNHRIVGAILGRSLASLDDSEVFPNQTASALAYKLLGSRLCNRMRQVCPAKETGVLFQSMALLETYRRSGLFHSYTKRWLELLQSKGYKTVYAISRTDHNSKRLKSANFEVIERISYSEFVFNEKKPFKPVASQLGGATLFAKIIQYICQKNMVTKDFTVHYLDIRLSPKSVAVIF